MSIPRPLPGLIGLIYVHGCVSTIYSTAHTLISLQIRQDDSTGSVEEHLLAGRVGGGVEGETKKAAKG